MYTEVKEVTYVITSFLIKQIPRQKVAWFAESFANNFLSRMVNYRLDPSKVMPNELDDQNYWIIVSRQNNYISPVVIQSTVEVALGGGELLAYLPCELSVYVSMGEVKARINGVTQTIWKDVGISGFSSIPWPVLQQSLSERTVMVLSYDQKIRSDFIPLELVDPEKIGHNYPLVGADRSLLPDGVKMFRAAGPARFVFTSKNFATTRFGNRRRRSCATFSSDANAKQDFAVRRASQEVVPCEEKSHFFQNNWWNSEFLR